MQDIAITAYTTSIKLAIEKGPFPLFDADKYLGGQGFAATRLPGQLQDMIRKHGIRNSHLLSIAPTWTISLSADNVSSGIEPVFLHSYTRDIRLDDGPRTEVVEDYGVRVFQVGGRTTEQVTVDQHIRVLAKATEWVDSAVSKTVNIPSDYSFQDFKQVYMKAWEAGAKGCTTFRSGGKLQGILNKVEAKEEVCFIDFATGKRECA